MGDENSKFCRKEKEIAEIRTKVNRIEKVVMDGNGNEPLATCVPKLSDAVADLNKNTIPDLQKGMRGFLRFQEHLEGTHEGKEVMRRRIRWLIGIGVFINLGLLGLLVTLILSRT